MVMTSGPGPNVKKTCPTCLGAVGWEVPCMDCDDGSPRGMGWDERIARARRLGFSPEDEKAAESFRTCAVGEAMRTRGREYVMFSSAGPCYRPRRGGAPTQALPEPIALLGVSFMEAVNRNDTRRAGLLLAEIRQAVGGMA